MRRRNFLKISSIGAGIAVASPPVIVNTNGFFSVAVKTIVRRELHFLKIHPDALDQFAVEFARYITKRSFITTQKLRFKIAAVYFIRRNSKSSETVNYVAGKFLLSSDFFLHGMDETRVLNFVGMHDMDLAVCANPFSHLYYSADGKLKNEALSNVSRAELHS